MVWGTSLRPRGRKSSNGSFHPTQDPDDEPTIPVYGRPYEDVGLWSGAPGSLIGKGL